MDVLQDRDPAAAEQQSSKGKSEKMTREEIKNLFMKGIDCSQVITEEFADQMGLTREQAGKISSCFGGGMMCGETCGAVTGALMVLGMKYGHWTDGQAEQKEMMAEKTAEFKKLFQEKYPSCICKDLLGYDLGKEGEMEKAAASGKLLSLCPEIVEFTIDILEKVL